MRVSLKSQYLFFGWCHAIPSKSKCRIRVFPFSFSDIPYFLPVVYIRTCIRTHSHPHVCVCVSHWFSFTIYVQSLDVLLHDDVIKWKHFPRNWPFVRGIRAGNSPVPVNSPHKGQWRGALMFSLICVWINGWVNNREAGDLRRCRGHYDVGVMETKCRHPIQPCGRIYFENVMLLFRYISMVEC